MVVIEAKVAGQEIVAPPVGEIPEVINLMEALKASVARVPEDHASTTPCVSVTRSGQAR
jgi:non-homologous end joining protein Ku